MATLTKSLKTIGLWIIFFISYWIACSLSLMIIRLTFKWSFKTISDLSFFDFITNLLDGNITVFIMIIAFLYLAIFYSTKYIFMICPKPKVGAYILLVLVILRGLNVFITPGFQWPDILIDAASTVILLVPLGITISKKSTFKERDWKPNQIIVNSKQN